MTSSAHPLTPLRIALAVLVAAGSLMVVAANARLLGLDPDLGAGLAGVALTKWFCLALAVVLSIRCAQRLGTVSWRLLATGITLFLAAQSTLVFYQLIRHVSVPFPSWADPSFIGGMLALAAGTTAFLRELAAHGFPLRLRQRLPRALPVILGLGAVLFWWMLRPLLPPETWDAETILGLLYPICDLLLLVPAVLLYGVTREFADGRVRGVWAALVATFLLFLFGDLLFALFLEGASPLLVATMDLCYVWGYAGLAWTALRQLELSR